MKTSEKIVKSLWVLLSFILFLNGFAFIYVGTRHRYKNWIIEGIIYEIPWFFYFLYFAIYQTNPVGFDSIDLILSIAFLLYFICIIRSFWVASKLWNVYDNNEKYTYNPVELKNPNESRPKDDSSAGPLCCLCIAIIFIIFAIMAIL